MDTDGCEVTGLTNAEMLNLLDPFTKKYDYPIYHHFKWDHCEELGYHF